MKKNILASLLLSTLIASPVFAEGFYIGADVGSSKVSSDFISGNDTTFGIHGGYKFSPYLAAEIGYRDHGKAEEKYSIYNLSVNAKSVNASVIGSYPFTEAFSVYGRLGVASIKATLEANTKNSYTFYSDEKTETKAMFGIGAQYAFNKNFSLRTEYTQYAEIEDVKLSAFTIGANYSF
ncbi:outer membrane beta-barrel protein [Iodobacter fluviatilis]|uniref:OOP family OmpA-OmpF porin n=1 Tax=Iodobacter fluviatilis TaxID=537 RepID=A0A377SVP2_9NEIS|nr:outer membrane beta-barrel protein [Iodobacter fluviatilis]TCU87890.1 OOP family OmpA-OmpF porin [Iodobacter fluviatilis]STR45390.1 Outer membrane protein II* [Iodobacter fluviatilis]